ncbi:ModE molybdate transport repressor domain-containing protein [Enterococcus moraviensis ATCC BAA-383]|uniref:ModE molybdate transport repressor domain-containing protein n=1 Tax=Enterococcus moraviensis ATCC BAA-383 TaxID=1158609 RepID=R2TFB3_9ENTE|nr:LysR family transcriptional regulator [Enterococcus moraviensis]EOH98844.1 ModE molybdate transport repressor domain-containing protein [Enterococcus moraviensis ATCC BAA-383]EOT71981.1 molybdenum transporter [Enterococcus moraviensis ATCC BAA-383]OJG68100.1 ModE molybdate transport repressor domain-containing protein [Enterococcus moraviensis]
MKGQEAFNYTLNLKLRTNRIFFGPGVVELLQRITQTGSLNTAAKQMRMSYNKAWRMIKKAEEELGYPLVNKSVGGSNGGGSTVTEQGKQLTAKFLLFQKKTYQITNHYFSEIFSDELNSKDTKLEERE